MIGGYEILVQGFLRCDITVVEKIGRFNDCVCWVRGHAFDCGSLGSIVVCEKHACTSRESLRDGVAILFPYSIYHCAIVLYVLG